MYLSGRPLELEELDGIVALRSNTAKAITPSAAAADQADIRQAAGCPEAATLGKDLERLGRAGWQFFKLANVAPLKKRQAAKGHAVYCDQEGRLKIDGRSLAIRLSEEISEIDAKKWFTLHSLTPARKLRFQPNLFIVETPEGGDTLSIAADLEKDDSVIYAEPQLVEVIGPRQPKKGGRGVI